MTRSQLTKEHWANNTPEAHNNGHVISLHNDCDTMTRSQLTKEHWENNTPEAHNNGNVISLHNDCDTMTRSQPMLTIMEEISLSP